MSFCVMAGMGYTAGGLQNRSKENTMRCHDLSRRQFLARVSAAAGAAMLPGQPVWPAAPTKGSHSDIVTLGKSGIKTSRLGFGTGSNGGRVQRDLGPEAFTELFLHAFDKGVRYIDTADNYKTHGMVAQAIKGLPREELFILSKMPWRKAGVSDKPLETIERYLKELGTDHIDCLMIHCATVNDWHQQLQDLMAAFDEAKKKGMIRAKGVSCHGLPGLTRATLVDWVDVHLVRVNHKGHRMDAATDKFTEPGDYEASMREIRSMHEKGRGVLGMKIIGNGDFTDPEEREKSIRHTMACGCVDAVTIGFKSKQEVDEAISRINAALA